MREVKFLWKVFLSMVILLVYHERKGGFQDAVDNSRHGTDRTAGGDRTY